MNALGDLTKTNTLLAEQLGTAQKHVAVAYIDSVIPAPGFNEDLQTTCDFGHATDTDIDMTLGNLTLDVGHIEVTSGKVIANHVETTGHVEAGTHIEAGSHIQAVTDIITTTGHIKASLGNIESTTGTVTANSDIVSIMGNIESTTGKVTAGSGIINETGDIVCEKGRLSVGTSGNPTSATGNIINYGTGSIICEQGHVRAHTYIKADTGDIECLLGNITATVGNISALGGNISGINLTATSGDVIASAGDIKAPSGGFSCGSSSLLNRLRYNTYYGSTSYASPVQLLAFPLPSTFTIPAGYYNCVLFCKGIVADYRYTFEFVTSYLDVLKDYTIKVNVQPAYDPLNTTPTGVKELRIGTDAQSYKFSVQVHTPTNYQTNQILKFSFHFEYSPSP